MDAPQPEALRVAARRGVGASSSRSPSSCPTSSPACPPTSRAAWKRWKEFFEHEQPENEPLPRRVEAAARLPAAARHPRAAPRPHDARDRACGCARCSAQVLRGHQLRPAALVRGRVAGDAHLLPALARRRPLADVRARSARPLGKTEDAGNGLFFSVSLGQGQEPVAEKALDRCTSSRRLGDAAEHRARRALAAQAREEARGARRRRAPRLPRLPVGAAAEGRAGADPAELDQADQRAAVCGLKANLLRAYGSSSPTPSTSELNLGELAPSRPSSRRSSSRSASSTRSCASGASSAPIGWNRGYPFNPGDLSVVHHRRQQLPRTTRPRCRGTTCATSSARSCTAATSPTTRTAGCARLPVTYVREELLDGLALFPKFEAPPQPLVQAVLVEYIEEKLATRRPIAYGLHANSEINFMTAQRRRPLQGRRRAAAARRRRRRRHDAAEKRQAHPRRHLLEKLPDLFSLMASSTSARADERTPYTSASSCRSASG